MTTNNIFDVIVSGGGPVGLFFALQMATRGHSVCIVDPKPGPTDQSRALLITSRTMEILETKGLAAEILYNAFISSGMKMYRNGQAVAYIDPNGDTPFPQMTVLVQGQTERIIHKHINEETDLTVNWNTELVSYTQDEHHVTAIIRDVKTQEERIIESKYIVGADGTHSRVRKGNSDWTYKGVAIHTKFGLADLTIKGKDVDQLMEKMNTFMSGTTAMGIVRINPMQEGDTEPHVFRVFGNLEQYSSSVADEANINHGLSNKAKEEPPSLEFMQAWIKEKTAPLELEVSDMIWSTHFRINERIANGFRRKRAFLAGDAAHCHSPVGGQGMNLGLQDADNLAWKMSSVLQNKAVDPEALLDSYSIEREPHAKATIEMTSRSTRVGLAGSEIVGNIRNYLLSTALMIPQLRHMAFSNAMQLWVTLEPTSKALGTSSKGLIQPGHFLPDSGNLRKSLMRETSKQRLIQRNTIHELLIDNQNYTAIFVGTCLGGSKPNTHLMEKFWKDTRAYPVRRLIIQSAWHSHNMKIFPEYVTKDEREVAEESFYTEERMDLPISVTSRVGLLPLLNSYLASSTPPSVLVIVRPDLYVAEAKLINNEIDLDEALKFLSSTIVLKTSL